MSNGAVVCRGVSFAAAKLGSSRSSSISQTGLGSLGGLAAAEWISFSFPFVDLLASAAVVVGGSSSWNTKPELS